MLEIAVCDDDRRHLDMTVGMLERWLGRHTALSGRLAAFDSGEDLLERTQDKGGFDIYLLDVIMPGLDGIETGKKLRELGGGGEIIYLTTSPDHAVESYLARAFFYLLKPVDEARLFEVLDAAAEQLERRRSQGVMVALPKGSRLVPLDRILYVERVGRFMRYHCTDGIVDSRSIHGSFKEMNASLLADPRFCLCGASYVFNLQRVAGVSGGQALLDGGGTVDLPKRRALDFKSAWGRYWLEDG